MGGVQKELKGKKITIIHSLLWYYDVSKIVPGHFLLWISDEI